MAVGIVAVVLAVSQILVIVYDVNSINTDSDNHKYPESLICKA